METNNANGDEVITLQSEDEEEEAEQVAREILDLSERKNIPLKDIAVLYRCNFQSRYLEERFSQDNIPYFIYGGRHFYAQKEIQGLLDYLRLIGNPYTPEGSEILKRIINTPCRYVSRKFLEEMESQAIEQGLSLFEALEQFHIPMPFIRKNIKVMLDLINLLIQEYQTLNPLHTLQYLRNVLDYDRYITEDEVPSPDDEKLANLQQLELAASKFEDIPSFIRHIETFAGEQVGDDPHGVRLMTIHKSKGLEFQVVFVVGLLEGSLTQQTGKPGRRTKNLFRGYLSCHETIVPVLQQLLSGPACL